MINMPECFAKVAELAIALKIPPLNQLTGIWMYQVDEEWGIKVNGHDHEIDGVPAFHMLVEYNGWPAGVIHPATGGVIASGSHANEYTFISALEANIADIAAEK